MVSVSDGQTFLVDLEKKQVVATIAAAKGSRVTVHPSAAAGRYGSSKSTTARRSAAWRSGRRSKVDADFGPFGDDRDKAAAAVDAMLTAAGMTASTKDEPFHLAVAVAGGPSERRDYAPDIFTPPNQRVVQTVDVPCNVLTATLSYKGQPVCSQALRLTAGGYLRRIAQQSF